MKPLLPIAGAIGLLIALTFALATPSIGDDAVPEKPAAEAAEKNPHGQQDQCDACHDPSPPGEDKVGPMRPVVQTCLECHPTADMHPVDIRPNKIDIAKGFPLEHGLMTCATCHYEPGHADVPAEVTPNLHRGGPYERTIDFCLNCHQSTGLKRVDPHHPVAEDRRRDGSCAACHTGVPTPFAPPAEAELRPSADAVCLTCHSGAPHAGAVQHVGKALEEGIDLPSLNGNIACFTCHDVHDGGAAGKVGGRLPDALVKHALEDEWKALEGVRLPGKRSEHKPMLVKPLEGGELCRTCHQEGP